MSRIALIFVLGFCFASSTTASAQSWPMRPVTMVVPFAAGGPMDTVGRIMAAALSDTLGQSVIVENVGGGGGMTGSARVAKATPDGSQFVLGNVGTHAVAVMGIHNSGLIQIHVPNLTTPRFAGGAKLPHGAGMFS